MKIRIINGGMLYVFQIITKKKVYSFTKNRSLLNGDKGIKISVQDRNLTTL